jgi:hypothetical protein
MLNFKNKTEREEWAKDYRRWRFDDGRALDIWREVPELGLRFYRYDFKNGAALIATEYSYYSAYRKAYQTKYKFCLMLPENDPYIDESRTSGDELHRTYTLEGCSLGTVVDYMTKNKGLI